MSSGVPYIGSKISLITTSDMRYEGPCAQHMRQFSLRPRGLSSRLAPTDTVFGIAKCFRLRFLRTLNREESTIAAEISERFFCDVLWSYSKHRRIQILEVWCNMVQPCGAILTCHAKVESVRSFGTEGRADQTRGCGPQMESISDPARMSAATLPVP